MKEPLDEYRKKLSTYSIEDLNGICTSIDREKHGDKYQAVLEELRIRKESSTSITDSESAHERKFNTLWRRAGAGIVDGLIFFVLTLVFLKPFKAIETGEIALITWNLVGLASVVYSILMHWILGATIGKIIFNVKVVDNKSELKISLRQAVIRDLVPLFVMVISTIEAVVSNGESVFLLNFSDNINGWWGIAEIVTAYFNKKRRAVHDFMAGTVCIRVNR